MADFKKRLSIQFRGLNPELIVGFTLIFILLLLASGYLPASYVFPNISSYEIISVAPIFVISYDSINKLL